MINKKIYQEINKALIGVLDKYSDKNLTQYDMLLISTNLVSSVCQVFSKKANVSLAEIKPLALKLLDSSLAIAEAKTAIQETEKQKKEIQKVNDNRTN